MKFDIQWFDRVNSTNELMKDHISSGKKIDNRTIFATHEQVSGHGRLKRKWISSSHTNLCFSIYIESKKSLNHIPSLTMAGALGICDFLKSKNIKAKVKWPNDVIVNQKKICGILSEHINSNLIEKSGLILGIGLNVNMNLHESKQIDQPATSMFLEKNIIFSLEKTLYEISEYLEFWILKWEFHEFRSLKKEWIDQTGPIGREIEVHDGELVINGKFKGYGEYGELLIERNSKIKSIWAGEIPL